jgi:hypothetical protein
MAPWLQLAALVFLFLLGGLAVSELFCRRVTARHAKQWAEDHASESSESSALTGQ